MSDEESSHIFGYQQWLAGNGHGNIGGYCWHKIRVYIRCQEKSKRKLNVNSA